MKTYNAVFNLAKTQGVYGISLVENPAMEGNFIALSQHEGQKVQLKTVDEEQRLLLGLALQPDKPIYRNQGDEEFNIIFNSETIKELSHHFFRGGYQSNSTIEHDNPIKGVTFVESWIVENQEMDKSVNFGLSYPKGSWMVTMKVDDDKLWQDYVKSGKVKGFSIDAMVELQEVKLKSQLDMAESTVKVELTETKVIDHFIAKMSKLLGLEKSTDVKLGIVKSAEGDVTYEYEGEMPEAGAAMWVNGEDGQKIPVPAGTYPLEDGHVVTVTEEGIIGDIQMPVKEGEPAPAAMDADTPAPLPPDQLSDEEFDKIKSILVKYAEQTDQKLKAFEAKLSEVVKENTELKKEVLELGEQPAAKAKKSQPTQVDFSKMTELEKRKYYRNNG